MSVGYWTIPVALLALAAGFGLAAILVPSGRSANGSYKPGMDEALGAVAGVLVCAALGIGLFSAVLTFDQWQCRRTADNMGVDSRYSIATKCLVKISNRWIPLENYRGTEDQ